jgi:uncharacterized DUF497 family protein
VTAGSGYDLGRLTVCTTVHILRAVKVAWDLAKAKANRRKHGVDFADAATTLLDELATTVRDDSAEEDRYVTIGSDALGRILVVVYAWAEDGVRLISARKATKKERRQYEGKT